VQKADKERVLQAIAELGREYGYPPTYRELSAELDISLSAVYRWVTILRQEGRVKAQEGLARSLTVHS
jgi:DNA-binding IscR family transcriptional regulator